MIYCFDLDKTLCTQNEQFDFSLAMPIKERITKVNRLYEQGHRIIIETARGSMSGKDWQEFTKNQLKEWGVKYHVLRTGVKMYADFYIDDKGISDIDFFK